MTNAPFTSIEDYRDIESLNHYADAVDVGGQDPEQVLRGLRAMSRDNARTPMQWDDSPNAGFSSGTPWISVNPNYVEVNAAAAMADPSSVFHYYRRLIGLRHTEPAVALGNFAMLAPHDDVVYAFTRRYGDVELLVLGNFSGQTLPAPVPEAETWAQADLLIGNYPASDPPDGLMLRPWEARVYRRVAGGQVGG